jgi:cyclopropane-fatty-acyl-phospholipid synthase
MTKYRFARNFLLKLLKHIQYGSITLVDGKQQWQFQGNAAKDQAPVEVSIHQPRVYRRVLLQGTLGASESYMVGDWDTDNLTRLIEIIIENKTVFAKIENALSRVVCYVRHCIDLMRPNNVSLAKQHILAHYDLGNEFFKLFLDPTMMYSCALYDSETRTLEEASLNKLDAICKALHLSPADHLLEIGTGWGGFAIHAAQKYGCRITTTTISDKQHAYVKQQIERLGLEKQITLLNQDYRQLTGQYDKIVSIEMLEAVGWRHFDTFFNQCNRLLKQNGLFFLQTIVINHQAYHAAKNEIDFIKKYIFPGGCLPSIPVIEGCVASQTQLELISLTEIGKHYVKTLNTWQDNFRDNIAAVKAHGFDDHFIRMWNYYFSYCAAGFNTGYINDIHAVWRKK